MTGHDARDEGTPGPTGRFADDLIGLDPNDPEVRAFAAHLDRMEHPGECLTVEGYLDGVQRFADSANRTGGVRRHAVLLIVLLLLLGVVVAAWNVLALIAQTFFG